MDCCWRWCVYQLLLGFHAHRSFPACPSTAVVSTLSGWELVGLFCVSVAATAQEIVSGQHRASKTLHVIQLVRFGSITGSMQRCHLLLLCSDAVYGYDTKPADSEGLTLGTVTLPWTFTALLITDLLQKGSSGKAIALCWAESNPALVPTTASIYMHATFQ